MINTKWNVIYLKISLAINYIKCVYKNIQIVNYISWNFRHYVWPRFWWFPPGPWFNIKMSSYQYRKSHCGDKTVVRSSYLHNGISYTDKIVSFYWISPQNPKPLFVNSNNTPFTDRKCVWINQGMQWNHRVTYCSGNTFHISLRWRHNERDGVSIHQPHSCFLKCLFRRRSKKTSKIRIIGL